MKRCFAVLAIAAMSLAVMCGAAFADARKVAETINKSALGGPGGLTATANGNTVTVTGTKQIEKTGPVVLVDLDDLGGVTIDWKADLTVTAGNQIHDDGNTIFSASGSGTFNMKEGKIEIVSTPDRKMKQVWVFAGADMKYVLSGGTVSGDHAGDRGFETADGSITLDGATVYFPNGQISATVLTIIKNDISKVTGVSPTGESGDPQERGFEMFGKITYAREIYQEVAHYTIIINKGAEVDFKLGDIRNSKPTFSCVVEDTVDFSGVIGKLTSLTVKPGGVAVIADDSDTSIDTIIVEDGGTLAGEVSAQASYKPNSAFGQLAVEGKLTIPAGKTLKLGNIKGLINRGSLVVNGKIELPSGTSPDDMKQLASDLGIKGSVFEMNGKTYNDQGQETTGGGSSSSGACSAGAAAFVALAALAAIRRRSK